ncbi:nucleotidyltransferase family protein [Acetobacterium woodii]|uniref:Uncharacterized protein n=1 Tax=Acetobacterium woodii (strain ATCC 29683 / DSM 1030 / JCM 2381 / KCTC 1655 / WB1) TaxID=931626 RepID=H6LIX9_ACEWD|nr:nucleotidyltransferase family protein [Acetobacterium woodii]AFA49868.1 hypothetical protein Awo_c31400 [Acetobacterium woodii DSM 1030]
MRERLQNYKHKCNVLKQIQSNKALFNRRLNNIQNFITVFVSAFITFIGFSGVDKIKEYIELVFVDRLVDINNIQMIYNILVFVLFLVVIFHLVFQFNSKQTDAEKAVSLLSSLINEIDDLLGNTRIQSNNNLVETIRYKYVTITQIIPSNTDREFLKAKKSLDRKVKDVKIIERQNLINLTNKEQEEYILKLIENNSVVNKILDVLKEQNEDLYLGGGVIRNIVWDELHNYTEMTPIEDVDVIYFDKLSCTKERDIAIENSLRSIIPNLKWSVKNQARMHTINNDEPYNSLQDAVLKWPETVSAILLRKGKDERYKFIAPFNFDDLFRLIVQPTPHFINKLG